MSIKAHPERPLGFVGAALWTLSIGFVMQGVVGVLEAAHPGAAEDLVTRTAAEVLAYSVILFGILRVHAPDVSLATSLGAKWPPFVAWPLAAVAGAGLAIPTEWSSELLARRFPLGEEERALVAKVYSIETPSKQFLVIIATVVLLPVCAELFFRGAIFTALQKKARLDLVILAAATFDALLPGNLRAIPSMLVLLVAIGWIRARTASVWPAVVARVSFFAALIIPDVLGHELPMKIWAVLGSLGATAAALLVLRLTGGNRALVTS